MQKKQNNAQIALVWHYGLSYIGLAVLPIMTPLGTAAMTAEMDTGVNEN